MGHCRSSGMLSLALLCVSLLVRVDITVSNVLPTTTSVDTAPDEWALRVGATAPEDTLHSLAVWDGKVIIAPLAIWGCVCACVWQFGILRAGVVWWSTGRGSATASTVAVGAAQNSDSDGQGLRG